MVRCSGGSNSLGSSRRSSIGRSDRLVDVDNRPVRKTPGLGEIHSQRLGQVLEQRQPVPQGDREDDQAVLVDQAEPGQGLDERGAAVGHDDVAAGFAPEGGYLGGEVAAGDVVENTTLGRSFMKSA